MALGLHEHRNSCKKALVSRAQFIGAEDGEGLGYLHETKNKFCMCCLYYFSHWGLA